MVKNNILSLNRRRVIMAHFAGIAAALVFPNLLTAQSASYNANTVPIAGFHNTAFGFGAFISNTSGAYNVALGNQALKFNYGGNFNVAIGTIALSNNKEGDNNVALGYKSLFYNTDGDENVAIGSYALGYNIDGDGNAALGRDALSDNTTGSYNVGLGFEALYSNTTSSFNVAIGTEALWYNTVGAYNTATGTAALFSNTTGNYNVANGFYALGNNVGGNNNTAAGYRALNANTSGTENVANGYRTLSVNTTGTNNTAIGSYADVSTGSLTNASAFGNGAVVNASNKIRLGNASVTTVEGSIFYMTSDKRFKSNISEEDVKGLEFIKKLRPVVYNLDAKKLTEFWTRNMPDSIRKQHLDNDFSTATAIRQTGFIAQEVEAAAKEVNYDFNGVHIPENENDNYSLAYSQFVVPLVKGMQEQQKMIEEQKLLIETLQQQVNQLVKMQDAPAGALSLPLIGASMEQNMPNPFTHETVINFELPQQVHNAYMSIYDLSGKTLQTLPIGARGASSITITADRLAAGMYMYSIVADGKLVSAKRMVVANKQ